MRTSCLFLFTLELSMEKRDHQGNEKLSRKVLSDL